MKAVAALFLASSAWFVVQGCSAGAAPTGGENPFDFGGGVEATTDGGPRASEASSEPVDSGSKPDVCKTCASNQICVNNACQALPPGCPCPLDSYCESATNTCKPGCSVADTECSAGRYCDLATGACKVGCRGDTACNGVGEICEDHACVKGCHSPSACPLTDRCENNRCVNTCPNCDDANPCTIDSCERGVCRHVAGNEGAVCPRGICATAARCTAGACVPTNVPDGTSCGTEYQMCLTGVCKSALVYCTNNAGAGFTYRDASGLRSGVSATGSCSCATPTMISTTDARSRACTTCKVSALDTKKPICW